MERQFKGVWFPAELWLNEELSMLEKSIYVEIDSLDNENHCTASNNYFADFCQASVSAVSKAIAHLKDLNMIEELEFDGRVRKLCVTKKRRLPSKKKKAAEENLHSINITNNINNKNISIKNTNSKKLVKKKSLYQKMEDEIHLFTDDINIQGALYNFLDLQLEIYREQGKVYYCNIFKNRLNKLKNDFEEKDWLFVIENATEHGWQNFYPVKEYDKPSKKKKYDEGMLVSEKMTDEQRKDLKRWQKEQMEKGERMVF